MIKITRRRLYVAGVLIVLAVLLAFATSALINARTFQLFGTIVTRVETSAPAAALTFDDGPIPGATDRILAILREKNVKATFFLVGNDLEKNPDLGVRIASEGHEIGNHSYSHQRMVFKSPSFIREEIERTDALIGNSGYGGPVHFRPPNGKKLLLLPYFLSRTGRTTVMWDVEPDSDPEIASNADAIVADTLSRTRPGSIILLHVMYKSREPSLEAVPRIIDELKKMGYEFKTVSELASLQQ